jgi:hypothetical protein
MPHEDASVELSVHDIVWSQERGHPVLVLKVAGVAEEFISIVLSPADAQALSSKPACECVERMRFAALVEVMLIQLGGRVTAVNFHLDAFSILRGELHIRQGDREVHLPANVADATLLGGRAKAPFLLSSADLATIRRLRDGTAETTPAAEIPEPIRAFIESLPADGLSDHPTT